MEIRDVVHGSIVIESAERSVIDSPYFQRLRQIKQLGFGEYSYPSATHNRYIHSLGALETATQAFDTIFGGPRRRARHSGTRSHESPELETLKNLYRNDPETHARFRAVVRLAALLHDCGHGPLSHTTEFAMPAVASLKLPIPSLSPPTPSDRKATHEDYTLKIILDSGLTPILEKAGATHGFKPIHIAALIDPRIDLHKDPRIDLHKDPRIEVRDGFFTPEVAGQPIDFRPILQQLISSELDADRMDYLRRDSLHAGVSYGQYDFDWLVGNLTVHVEQRKAYLTLQHRALYAFEDFLISRFHMFLMVYFHYKSVIFDEMLAQYFASPDCDYQLPSDIEAYCRCNDDQLITHLSASKNPWAKRIIEKRPYRVLIELHSGMPHASAQVEAQAAELQKMETLLKERQIHSILTTSTGELSKYFRRPGDPIFVRYDDQFHPPQSVRLEDCTDLFERYSKKRVIQRLYVAPEDYARSRRPL